MKKKKETEEDEKVNIDELVVVFKDIKEELAELKNQKGESVTLKNEKSGLAIEILSHSKSITEIQELAHQSYKFIEKESIPRDAPGVS